MYLSGFEVFGVGFWCFLTCLDVLFLDDYSGFLGVSVVRYCLVLEVEREDLLNSLDKHLKKSKIHKKFNFSQNKFGELQAQMTSQDPSKHPATTLLPFNQTKKA